MRVRQLDTVIVSAVGLLVLCLFLAGSLRACGVAYATRPVKVAEAQVLQADAEASRATRSEREALATERYAAMTETITDGLAQVQVVVVATTKALLVWGGLMVALSMLVGVVYLGVRVKQRADLVRLPDTAVVYQGRIVDPRSAWVQDLGADHVPTLTQGQIVAALAAIRQHAPRLPKREQFAIVEAVGHALTVEEEVT